MTGPNDDPGSEFTHVRIMDYTAFKTAVNMLTVRMAVELEGTGINVIAARPG